ncbi:MAG: helix-turn-helix transcriptional regulator [Aureliella sp.]
MTKPRARKATDLSDWVKYGREARGMTQAQLADMVGLTTVQLSKIENGRGETSLATLRRTCEIFDLPFIVRANAAP